PRAGRGAASPPATLKKRGRMNPQVHPAILDDSVGRKGCRQAGRRNRVCIFMARPMSPEILSLPLMKAIWPFSLPVVMSTQSWAAIDIVMFADGAVPLLTSALPSLIVTYHCPPLSPLRLNWIVAFMFFAAFSSSWPGIASKISWGVILKLLLSMGWWGLTGLRRLGERSLSRSGALHRTAVRAPGGAGPQRHRDGRRGTIRCRRPSAPGCRDTSAGCQDGGGDRQRRCGAVGGVPASLRARSVGRETARAARCVHALGGDGRCRVGAARSRGPTACR